MEKIFDIDGPVMRFFSRIGDLILINLLFLICCLPVVTAGASAVSMYTLTMRFIRKEEHAKILESFFLAFKKNFKRATGIWGIFLAIGLVLAANYWLMILNPNSYPLVMRVLVYFLTIIFFMNLTWVFPLHARFENKVISTIKNSLVMAITYLLVTILTTALTVLPVILLYYKTEFFLRNAIFWLFIGFSLAAYIKSFLFVRVFEQYEYRS